MSKNYDGKNFITALWDQKEKAEMFLNSVFEVFLVNLH